MDLSVSERLEIAKSAHTSPEVLARLAKDWESLGRVAVAVHPQTTPEVLTHLARDKDWQVRYAVAKIQTPFCNTYANLAITR
ncbi:hypothetical protein [uncultured Thermosynechococcus sp.]|uniref:variant leucine-rich repeat-containing protein n=1 Tax=uncultured Thermosynechococcus sp. TaxID=436945 RepID=UPI00260337DF|nr:hypothetical protein [uncultured Thermosynechococcus sp.]